MMRCENSSSGSTPEVSIEINELRFCFAELETRLAVQGKRLVNEGHPRPSNVTADACTPPPTGYF